MSRAYKSYLHWAVIMSYRAYASLRKPKGEAIVMLTNTVRDVWTFFFHRLRERSINKWISHRLMSFHALRFRSSEMKFVNRHRDCGAPGVCQITSQFTQRTTIRVQYWQFNLFFLVFVSSFSHSLRFSFIFSISLVSDDSVVWITVVRYISTVFSSIRLIMSLSGGALLCAYCLVCHTPHLCLSCFRISFSAARGCVPWRTEYRMLKTAWEKQKCQHSDFGYRVMDFISSENEQWMKPTMKTRMRRGEKTHSSFITHLFNK